jgi:lanosterol synthase
LDDQQITEEILNKDVCYRHRRKGAWAFSTREQGYTVSDCTSEALKSVIMLQRIPGFPKLVSDDRIKDAIDKLLTMQNASGGFASYEVTRGSEYMEYLNAAEVFGRIMVEYDYPECTTAVVTALALFQEHDPMYRKADIAKTLQGAVKYIRDAQRVDGSWYGSWGICFTYAGMFALESLASVGETYATSPRVQRACKFLLDKQKPDGGWGESYKSCETGVYTQHENSQVVQTCWALIGLMNAEYQDQVPLKKGIELLMSRQLPQGGWAQEAIEGVFNKSW